MNKMFCFIINLKKYLFTDPPTRPPTTTTAPPSPPPPKPETSTNRLSTAQNYCTNGDGSIDLECVKLILGIGQTNGNGKF